MLHSFFYLRNHHARIRQITNGRDTENIYIFFLLIFCKSLNITYVVQIEIEMFFPLHCSFGRVRMKGKLWLDN